MVRAHLASIVLLCGTASLCAAATDPPGTAGPWAVGHRSLASIDASRANRPLPLEVWYPVDATDAHGAPAFYSLLGPLGITSTLAFQDVSVSAAGVRPLIVFSHGSGGIALQSIKLMEHLASHGFVVVAPSHTGNTQADNLLGTAVPISQALLDRSPDVSFVIDSMLARGADLSGPFFGRIDAYNIGVAGHSLGGFTAVAMASGYGAIPPDPRVRAIMPIAPATGPLTDAELSRVTIPTLLMTGTLDGLLAQQARIFGLIDSGPFRHRVDVLGATHTHFAAICDIANALIAFGFPEPSWPALGAGALVGPYHDTCIPPAFSLDEATRIQNQYAAAFFRRHLRGEVEYDSFLTRAYAEANEPFTAVFDAPVAATSAKVVLGNLLAPSGDDTLRAEGRCVPFPETPPLDPAANGMRLVIQDDAGGTPLDAVLPGGDFDPVTRAGWKTHVYPTGITAQYGNSGAIVPLVGGIRKLKFAVKSGLGVAKLNVVGKTGSYVLTAGAGSVHVTLIADSSPGPCTQCCELRFTGPESTCTFRDGGATLRCR